MRSAARPARANPLQWLLIAAAIQLALFIGFAGFYFGSEQKRHDELKDVQGELHHLRAENARQQKRLIHANKRMLKYEADIKAELRTASPYDADAADAAVEEGEEDVGMIEREPDDMMEGQPSADDAAGSNEVAHAHGSIAPAAHIQPVAAARRAPGANVSMRGHGDHGHPERASMPSAAASAAVAAALPPVLRGRCVQLTHEYWTYELCFGRRVRQFHKSAGGSEDEQISLGRYVAPKGAGHHGLLLQRYKGGDACASGTNRRSVEAKLVCADGSSDVSLVEASEPHTCHYLLIVHVPRANCGEVSGGTESIGAGGNGHEGGGENAERGDSAAHAAGILDAAKSTQGPVSSTASSAAAASLAPELALESLVALDSSGTAAVETKRNAVVHALRHAWRGYERYAFGADEVKPISKAQNNWIGQGLTILDALDVLWMAGLRSEYSKAAEWVHAHLDFSRNAKVSFFETTIRCLGGLLSAHELTGDAVFLQKASDLGERLGRAFGSGPGGMPHTAISLGSGEHSMPSWLAGNVLLAEVGTVQMEFASLASHSGQRQLREKADHVFDVLDREGPPLDANGGRLWPIHVRPDSGKPSGAVISWGAMGDSFYEYLLKYWLLTGKRHEQYRRMYLESTRALITRLIVVEGGLTYVAESKNGQLLRKMDHLVCFVPGMLALGAQHIPEVHDVHMDLAARLAETCYQMYARQKTGLAPEFVRFDRGRGMVVGAAHNILRPEAIESMFYMWRFTRDPKYREWGWKMFLAFEKHCRVPTGGYVGIKNVGLESSPKEDKMETFWLAETLKYFLLLFSDDSLLDLSTHVLNTEAHPLRVLG